MCSLGIIQSCWYLHDPILFFPVLFFHFKRMLKTAADAPKSHKKSLRENIPLRALWPPESADYSPVRFSWHPGSTADGALFPAARGACPIPTPGQCGPCHTAQFPRVCVLQAPACATQALPFFRIQRLFPCRLHAVM